MKFSKQEKSAYIRNEIKLAEEFVMNKNISKELKDYYNDRIDMLLEILASIN
jgi:hypothetical protein